MNCFNVSKAHIQTGNIHTEIKAMMLYIRGLNWYSTGSVPHANVRQRKEQKISDLARDLQPKYSTLKLFQHLHAVQRLPRQGLNESSYTRDGFVWPAAYMLAWRVKENRVLWRHLENLQSSHSWRMLRHFQSTRSHNACALCSNYCWSGWLSTCCLTVLVSQSSSCPDTGMGSWAAESTLPDRLTAAAEQTKDEPLGLQASDKMLGDRAGTRCHRL